MSVETLDRNLASIRIAGEDRTPAQMCLDGDIRQRIDNFNELLDRPVPESVLQKAPAYVGGGNYAPIDYIEQMLDKFFFQHWSVINGSWGLIANEVVYTLDLVVVHPVTGYEITRNGVGAWPIEWEKGGEITDLNQKKKIAAMKNVPAARAQAISNAAKSFGRIFGQGLNRKQQYNVGRITKAQPLN